MIAAATATATTGPAWAQQPVSQQSASQESSSASGKKVIRSSRGLLREGAFLANQPGVLRSLDHGLTAILFDLNDKGQSAPPMILLPCALLMRMEQIHNAGETDVHFFVSGQVFVYGRRNYLLPTYYRVDSGDHEEQPESNDEPAPNPDTDADPSVEALIQALNTATRSTPISIGAAGLAPVGANLLSDGSYLKPRRGRIILDDADAPAFVVDNDVDTADGPVAPMSILPSRGLAMIQKLRKDYGDDQVFLVSGRVFLYRSRNYLLPSMVQLQLDTSSGLTSAQ